MSDSIDVYSLNEENYREELFDLFEELDDDDNLIVGAEYWVGEKVEHKASSFFDHHSLLENADENAYEEGGDYAENFATSAPNEAKEELSKFIQAWADKHIQVNFWGVKNCKKLTVTQELIDEFRS